MNNKNDDVKLIPCNVCNGAGRVECCGSIECRGFTLCHHCSGKGERLYEIDRERKKTLENLLKYR